MLWRPDLTGQLDWVNLVWRSVHSVFETRAIWKESLEQINWQFNFKLVDPIRALKNQPFFQTNAVTLKKIYK